ncbi:MAG: hypothetical protein JRM72_01755 [Nitrososphaerota archaeon]|nr:hypothetical protein [Nitrososphaerota archaeon]
MPNILSKPVVWVSQSKRALQPTFKERIFRMKQKNARLTSAKTGANTLMRRKIPAGKMKVVST